MRTYFFLRHFETMYNRNHLLSGCEPNIPVVKTHPISCNIRIDFVVCSPALRCQQTVETFLERYSVGTFSYNDLFVERNLGKLQGTMREVAVKEYPNIFENNKLDVFATPPDGESYTHFFDRVGEAKLWMETTSKTSDNILICSHNQFLKMLFFRLEGKPVDKDEWNKLTFPFGEIVPINELTR